MEHLIYLFIYLFIYLLSLFSVGQHKSRIQKQNIVNVPKIDPP